MSLYCERITLTRTSLKIIQIMHAEGYTVYLEIALIICECRKHYA
ncbi:hypothetical protein PHOSAC3_140071 [Mesotoga infera]|nr:hypothetical protein PHOSAC3_140071 [Mesotoga infera]